MNIWRKLNPKRAVCTTCQGVDGIQGALPSVLQKVESWKFGALYRCSFCGRLWFQSNDGKRIARIQDRLLPLAQHWNVTPLSVDETLLDAIGGTARPSSQYIGVPCAVKNVSGQLHDKALVMFSKQPPYFWYKPEMVHWADEIVDVRSSAYALPLDVRQATFEKREVKMGFAPVGIVDPKGHEYTLSWESNFLDAQGLKGEEVRLSGRQSGWKKTIPPTPVEHYYFVDWFPRCKRILLQR
jgi:hypothetical protein